MLSSTLEASHQSGYYPCSLLFQYFATADCLPRPLFKLRSAQLWLKLARLSLNRPERTLGYAIQSDFIRLDLPLGESSLMKPIEQFVSRTGIVHVRSPDTPTAICDPQILVVPPNQAKPRKRLCKKCLETPIKLFIGQPGGYFIRWSFASGSQWHVEGNHPLLSLCGKEILVSAFSTGDRLNAIPAGDEERICVHCQRLLARERLRFELQSGTISVATI